MSKVTISHTTVATALIYLDELLNFVHDTPEDLQKCMDELESVLPSKPDCDMCDDIAFICAKCRGGEIEVEGMMVMCPTCSGWPKRCPDCGRES